MTYRIQRDHADVIGAAEQATGSRLVDSSTSGKVVKSRVLDAPISTLTPKQQAAINRMAYILSTAGGSSDIRKATGNAEMPKLALEIAEDWSFFTTREAPPPVNSVDHNPYRGMSTKDAVRRYMRVIEDICDRSTGALGPWWVK